MREDESTGKRVSSGMPLEVDASSVLQLSATVLSEIVEKKATCQFVGTAVATGNLPVRNEATNPLAGIEDVRRLGNTGGVVTLETSASIIWMPCRGSTKTLSACP